MALTSNYEVFRNALADRRSIYALNSQLPVSEDEVVAVVEDLTELIPDAFNQKSARVIIVFGEKNQQLWNAIYDAFDGKVPREKIDSFAAGAGTVLYFIDQDTIAEKQEQFAAYAHNFPVWANQANGMLQSAIWTAFRSLGIGASLQHYNPIIDEAVRAVTGAPESWSLVAEAPFGGIVEHPAPKAREDISVRVRVQR